MKKNRLRTKNILIVSAISLGYLLLSYFLIGFKKEQLILVGLFNLMYYLSGFTRRLIIALSVFIVFWIIFDYMKAFPNYLYNKVHIRSIYEAEKQLLGVIYQGQRMTLNEYFRLHIHSVLDIISGLSYLCWMPVPIGFGIYLFCRNKKKEYFHFTLSFLLINLIGFVVYYVYPAAPPWYIPLHGFTFNPHTPGNTAGMGRFDTLTGIPIFKSMYSESSNVFAAMPSLHAAYPLVTLFYAIRNKVKFGIPFFSLVMVGIWFAAVYSSHHYVLDIIAGICCAFAGIFIYLLLYKKSRGFHHFVDSAVHLIEKERIKADPAPVKVLKTTTIV